jgi:hypothetical protein
MGTYGSFPGAKRPVRETNHSPPTSAEVKNDGVIPPLPLMSSWHNAELSKHRENNLVLETKNYAYIKQQVELTALLNGSFVTKAWHILRVRM